MFNCSTFTTMGREFTFRKGETMNSMDIRGLKGKKVTVGYGRDENRVVITWNGGGMTFFAGNKGMETAEPEPITLGISPPEVLCEEAGFSQELKLLFLKLGRNRFLSATYVAEGALHVGYLPDEADIEFGTSAFMKAIRD